MALIYTPGKGWNTKNYKDPLIDLTPYSRVDFTFKWKNGKSYTIRIPTNRTYTRSELKDIAIEKAKENSWFGPNPDRDDLTFTREESDSVNEAVNVYSKKETQNENTEKRNKAYDTVLKVANSTQGGDYVDKRKLIRDLNLNETDRTELENNFKSFYKSEKLSTWDGALGAKPPYGEFDPTYYKKQNTNVSEAWQNAVKNDDLDIVGRYSENSYYLQHYTSQGKPAGLRGNAAENTIAAQNYVEKTPTDSDLQDVRALQLGVDMQSQTQRILSIPEVEAEWEKAKAGDTYWQKLAEERYLDVNKADEFAALFRLSDRPEDKQISFKYNANAGYGITELEDAINQAVGEKATIDVKKFGALAQNVLKDTIEEMKKAKAKEGFLQTLSGLDGFNEITNINKELTNSILGDTGVGGILSFSSGPKGEDTLEKNLQKISGVGSSTVYNWQKWFDDTLKTKYDKELELGYTAEEAQQNIKVESAFARDFIEKYLVPRFNTSRSMNEFVDYLDVQQSEQNPFQTQDMVNAAKMIANLRAEQYIDQLKKSPDKYFDANFYFNPTGDKAREDKYSEQTQTVAKDWEEAKKGGEYWAKQAYRFGVDINDKEAFARMHFQLKGQAQGYDAADDILNATKVSNEIYNKILPALKEEALKSGTIFGQFIKPDEFADEVLKGVTPENKESWQALLDQYGIKDFKGSVSELKDYITSSLQTSSAGEIRSQLKYLNEKRKKPTQQLLGVTYIERPEDYKTTAPEGETALYKTFRNAGYQGSEDDFYEKFFPDLDRSEQTALTKAGEGTGFQVEGINLKDPFASLGTLEQFLEDEKETITADFDTKSDGYFNLDLGEDEDSYTKTKSGSQILGEFTSMFKGL